jgi:DNA-binding NarL/FixJ family response regulator
MRATLRIALVEDQALVRHGLRAVLDRLEGLEVVVDAEDGLVLLEALNCTKVDIILMDIRMPKRSGIEITRELRAQGHRTPVLLLTTFEEPSLLERAVAAGAQGFLLKDAEPEELHEAILQLAAGKQILLPNAPQKIRDASALTTDGMVLQLTEREISVLRLVASGYSNKEIARVLTISSGTVKNHMTDIMEKLQARDRTHAVLKAIANRLL